MVAGTTAQSFMNWAILVRIGLDMKVGIAIAIALTLRTELHFLDAGQRTARRPEPLLHHIHLGRTTLDVTLHGAPAGVHAPAAKTQCLGLSQGVSPEVDALHAAKYLKFARMDIMGRHCEEVSTFVSQYGEIFGTFDEIKRDPKLIYFIFSLRLTF